MAGSFRQQVPRPPAATFVGPPSWAGSRLTPAVAVALLAELPASGDAAADADAAVLVALYQRNGEPVVLLTRRAGTLSRDPGHVAFPGGRIEAGERAVEAALREAREEVGLDPAGVARTGLLGVFGRRHRHVAAYLTVLDAPPQLHADEAEVEAILEVTLAALFAPQVCWEERWDGRPMYFFAHLPAAVTAPAGTSEERAGAATSAVVDLAGPAEVDEDDERVGDLVWGLSASILWNLAERLAQRAGPSSPAPNGHGW